MVWQLLTWPLDSLMWIAEQIDERASAEVNNKENLQKQLTELQIRFDLGEIEEADFTEREEALLLAIEAQLQEEQEQAEESENI